MNVKGNLSTGNFFPHWIIDISIGIFKEIRIPLTRCVYVYLVARYIYVVFVIQYIVTYRLYEYLRISFCLVRHIVYVQSNYDVSLFLIFFSSDTFQLQTFDILWAFLGYFLKNCVIKGFEYGRIS